MNLKKKKKKGQVIRTGCLFNLAHFKAQPVLTSSHFCSKHPISNIFVLCTCQALSDHISLLFIVFIKKREVLRKGSESEPRASYTKVSKPYPFVPASLGSLVKNESTRISSMFNYQPQGAWYSPTNGITTD